MKLHHYLLAFLTGIGYFQVSIGIYAGFYANWIALILGYSSLIFFFRFLRTSSKISLSYFLFFLLTTLFSHAYTWSVLIIVMGIFLGVSFLFNSYPRKRIILLLLVVLSSVVIDVVKTMMVESVWIRRRSKARCRTCTIICRTKRTCSCVGYFNLCYTTSFRWHTSVTS